ncbi:hypothetical protein L1049_021303 [Liquidambar formosana]|uniref:Flavin-containing monooxygenase n=1 Tax=Liquidambar formosana TaxID=63359 RepID=A0AAP0SEB7_LIQFO
MEEVVVVIVGAGPSGLATSVCLNQLSILNVILEREDCYASLWKKRTYDRLTIHLAKEFCSLPFMPHLPTCPTFMPKDIFVQYLDVVANGENGEDFVPELLGLDSFGGVVIHASEYKTGKQYEDKEALVVGCGNSGIEIAYDLSNFGTHTSIVVKSPFHVLTKEMVHLGMVLLKYLPVFLVDTFITILSKFKYDDLSKYGIYRPKKGPFYVKEIMGRSPVLDVGTVKKIQNKVQFENGFEKEFDVIVFATGYKSVANNWLRDYKYVLNDDGMPKNSFPTHWKGENGLYCAGLSRRGIFGVSMDAKAIADDIKMIINNKEKKLE